MNPTDGHRYVDHATTPAESDLIERAMAADPCLRAHVDALRRQNALLRAVEESGPAAPEALRAAIQRQVSDRAGASTGHPASLSVPSNRGRWFAAAGSPGWRRVAAGVAAVLVIAAAGLVLLFPRGAAASTLVAGLVETHERWFLMRDMCVARNRATDGDRAALMRELLGRQFAFPCIARRGYSIENARDCMLLGGSAMVCVLRGADGSLLSLVVARRDNLPADVAPPATPSSGVPFARSTGKFLVWSWGDSERCFGLISPESCAGAESLALDLIEESAAAERG